jgi:hypothetical protein
MLDTVLPTPARPGTPPQEQCNRVRTAVNTPLIRDGDRAVRGMVVHVVAAGQAPACLVSLLYEVADDRDLPAQARSEQ